MVKMLKIVYSNNSRSYSFENKDLWRLKPSQNFQDRASKNFGKKYMIYFPFENRRAIKQREDAFYRRENVRAPKKRKFKRHVANKE